MRLNFKKKKKKNINSPWSSAINFQITMREVQLKGDCMLSLKFDEDLIMGETRKFKQFIKKKQ